MSGTQLVYHATNGDEWFVEREGDGRPVAVIHHANAASGGARTRMTVAAFLAQDGDAPEFIAVRSAVGE